MKKLMIVFLLLVSLFTTSCDSGLEIVGMEILEYPSKIVYVIGIDDDLDLSGAIIRYHLKEGSYADGPLDDERELRHITIEHEIDFTKEGVYKVTLTRWVASCSFAIQVISQDHVERRLESIE